ncbi:hypothetical protein HCN44_001046 [Aphidius gifuensis]|uniref:Odorant-binding protein n=1 Tax=Aphidius gifuensis TaxID=684658 RepID=A0A835CNU1_APHGI|nr:hypothetical protein HCN44_001046 [Aphidius gifuensis]
MSKLINYLLLLSIFYCFIISVLSKNNLEYNDQNKKTTQFTPHAVPDRVDRKIAEVKAKYDRAINDYKIFQSLKCNGRFHYQVFARVDKICTDCQNVYMKHPVQSQCRNNCFENEYFVGCMETLFLNDIKDFENAKSDRSILCVNSPFSNRSIVLPPQPPKEEKQSVWDTFLKVDNKNFVNPFSKYSMASIYYNKFKTYNCAGYFDFNKFSQLEKICHDCFNLYRQSSLQKKCRNNCFENEFFDGCRESLLINETEDIKNIKKIKLLLRVDLPFVDRPLIVPPLPAEPEKSSWNKFLRHDFDF